MKILNNEKGTVSILIVFMIVGLIATLGLTVDYGIAVYENINLSNTLDAAALAGAQELPDENSAENVANNYLSINGVDPLTVIITFNEDSTQINLQSEKTVNHKLLKVVGINSSVVNAESGVGIVTLNSTSRGVRPFGVIDQSFNYGDEVTLKVNAEESIAGNFGALDLGNGHGACVFRQNTLYGYNGTLSVGDIISTEPGNMAMIINPLRQMINSNSETFDNFNKGSQRVWIVPLISNYVPNGRTDVEIIGFATFFINAVGKQSGQTNITGRFIEYVTVGTGSTSANNYGLYSVKLVK